jgi:ribosomal protein S3AE
MVQVKSIRKKFFGVKMPLTTSQVHLWGKSPEDMQGSIIKLDLTKNLRGKSLELRARVTNNNGVLEGKPLSLQLMGAYIRRATRKGTDYVEDSFETDCRDAKVRIKPFLITRKHVSRSVRNALREMTRKHLESYLKVRTMEEIFSEIMSNKIQKELSFKLKKIYPLALCEIRMIELISVKSEAQQPSP